MRRSSGARAASEVRRGSESQIERVPIGSLTPYRNNARTHSKRQIKDIARSIERFGFTNPVLVDANRQIIAGHGRVAAAQLLNIRTIPTLRIDHLNEAEKRAYVLADNKLAERAGWDREILAIELQGLVDLDFEIGLTGFEMAEVDLVLEEAGERADAELQPEDVPPDIALGSAVTKLGDSWVLGRHLLFCGDSLHADAYEAVLGNDAAEFVFADPPYNVPIDGHASGLGRIRHRDFAMASGEMNEAQFVTFLQTNMRQLTAHTSNGSIHCICMDWRHAFELLTAGRTTYRELKNICVWNKTNAGMGSLYRSKHELIFVWKNGTAPHINNVELGQFGRSRSNVWNYAGVNTLRPGRLDELAMHPTVKPVALVADAIKDCSRRGGLVLDPFGGSGTTIIAAEKTGRRARVIELDPRYCDVAVRRWEAYAGKQAIHATTGKTFEDQQHTPTTRRRARR